MKQLADKLRLIYKSFLLIALIFIPAYTFLHWLLFIKGGIAVKEDVAKFWLPFALPAIPVLIWLRPRIKLLHFNRENASFGFQFVALLAIAVPTIIAQEYMTTATGRLTALDNISQFSKAERTRYYSLKSYYVDKQHIAVRNTVSVSGKYNRDFNMRIYVVMPVEENVGDTRQVSHTYWVGKLYSKTISNRLSGQEKDEKYKAFADECQAKFDTTNFNRFSYLEVMGNTNDHDEFNEALKKLPKEEVGKDPVIFRLETALFEARSGNALPWIFGALGIGCLIVFLFLLFARFDETRLHQFKSGHVEKGTVLKEGLAFFVPREGFFITPILVNLNLLIYIIMVLAGLGLVSFKANDLLHRGANFKPLTTNGQWWRLLTSTFLHGGIMHLLANMYGLVFVGIFLEPLLGKTRYLLVYLVTGILASVASIWWYDATVSVGASGAIFGVYGFFLACLLLKVFPPDFGKAFLVSTLVFVGVNLLMGITGGIDNAAHIGGLLSGFILGLIMYGRLKKEAAADYDTAFKEE